MSEKQGVVCNSTGKLKRVLLDKLTYNQVLTKNDVARASLEKLAKRSCLAS